MKNYKPNFLELILFILYLNREKQKIFLETA